MATKPISQREARRLRQRVRTLEAREQTRCTRWASQWPDGVVISALDLALLPKTASAIVTARRLQHVVIVVPRSTAKTMDLYALPLAEQKED